MRMSMTMCMAGRMHKSHFFCRIKSDPSLDQAVRAQRHSNGRKSDSIDRNSEFPKNDSQIGSKKRSIFRSNPNRSAQTIPAPDLVQGHGPPSSHSPLIQSNFTTSLGVN
jgi:hypothetical protein